MINFGHILKPFHDFICLHWWRHWCWCTSLPMGITHFPYGVSLPTRIPFSNDLVKPHDKSFSSGVMSYYFAYLYLTAYIRVIAIAPSVTMIVFINSDLSIQKGNRVYSRLSQHSYRDINVWLSWVAIRVENSSMHTKVIMTSLDRLFQPGRAIKQRTVHGSSPHEAKVTSCRMQIHDTTWLELEHSHLSNRSGTQA